LLAVDVLPAPAVMNSQPPTPAIEQRGGLAPRNTQRRSSASQDVCHARHRIPRATAQPMMPSVWRAADPTLP